VSRVVGKDQKRVAKTSKATSQPAQSTSALTEDLRTALDLVKAEPLPDSIEDKEKYFMEQVGIGEQLAVRGV
jgi:mitochondrial import receptor subunit TOM20